VRRHERQQRSRADLIWYLIGFVVVQAGLAVGLERYWPAVRDPDFDDLEHILQERRAEAPDRPLVLVLGSSRTKMALRAESLNHSSDPAAPLILNYAVAGSGPMMEQVVLRRVLASGVRPRFVFIEIIPMFLSARDGAPIEERNLLGGRLTAEELASLLPYYAEPYRVAYPWLLARVLPTQRHQAELRDALGIDLPAAGRPKYVSGRDGYGWLPGPESAAGHDTAALVRHAIDTYESALKQPALADGPEQALRDLVAGCREERIPVALLVPPEGSVFRRYAPAVAEAHRRGVRDLARAMGVPLIDTSTWADDDDFYDGHHLTQPGADRYTARFAREVLAPAMTATSTSD
jgi:hypothetical protein